MQQQFDGILVVDKPAEMTSAKVVARLKKMMAAGKVGHTGTLDPFATGVMLCCINRATRLARFFLGGHKSYDACVRLGVETDTQDLTGIVVSDRGAVAVSEEQVRSVLRRFEGIIDQVPPVFSALKHNGQPLYKLARAGRPVQKPARRIFIDKIELKEIDLPELRLSVSCSAGTYIRTLCSDIGKALGCGAHLTALRRTASCGFTLEAAATLAEIEAYAAAGRLAGRIVPMAEALRELPQAVAGPAVSKKILSGQTFTPAEFMAAFETKADGPIKIVDDNGDLIAVMQSDNARGRIGYCCVFN